MKAGKSSPGWRTKLEKDIKPKIVDIPEKWAQRTGHGTMLIPTPLLVDQLIKKIPKGKLATVNMIREKLSDDYKADMTCPLTTGIFLNIAANTAEEDKSAGKVRVSPYWRVLKEGGCLNPKFPGGVEKHAGYLKQEGFTIIKGKGRDVMNVKDFENKLVDFF